MNQPAFGQDDIRLAHADTVFHGFFRILRYRLQHRLFDGSWGPPLQRELFVRGDSVGVLLFDPLRDVVALARQFRIGCLDNPAGAWVWEVVAGMVKPGESMTGVAVREVEEETGILISETALLPISRYYSSPGGSDERLQLYCALCDLPHSVEGTYGLAEEGEDIQVRRFATASAFNAMLAGEINNAATIIALQWLHIHHEQLRRQAVTTSP